MNIDSDSEIGEHAQTSLTRTLSFHLVIDVGSSIWFLQGFMRISLHSP
jgi:hypothetical protein